MGKDLPGNALPRRRRPAVYAFDHAHQVPPRKLKDLLGGKGAGLAEMTSVLGLPVPPGFTVAVPVCRTYRASGWPCGLTESLEEHLGAVEAQLGRRFGDPADPLLLAVRSGAAASMPGMLDTVLNLGLNEDTVRGLGKLTGDEQFAWDCYRRLLLTYAKTVLHTDLKEAPGHGDAQTRAEAVVSRLHSMGVEVPADPHQQLRGAVEAVFRSWDCARAQAYRRRENIAEDLGTAVNVQAMVFGNHATASGTGVAFTRNPATGTEGAYGDFLPHAQGEDVVAGTVRTLDISALGTHLPGAEVTLARHLSALERHYRDMCDVEFTVERGTLWILQTRIAKRGPVAAVRAAVQMVEDPTIALSPAEAVARVPQKTRAAARQEILASARTGRSAATAITTGLPASPGRATGKAVFTADEAADAADRGEGPLILVRSETSPEDVHGMGVAAGILTSHGGLVSHAAVVARGWAIPAVVGADTLDVRTDTAVDSTGRVLFQAGDLITIDGVTGQVWLGESRDDGVGTVTATPEEILSQVLPELAILEAWASDSMT